MRRSFDPMPYHMIANRINGAARPVCRHNWRGLDDDAVGPHLRSHHRIHGGRANCGRCLAATSGIGEMAPDRDQNSWICRDSPSKAIDAHPAGDQAQRGGFANIAPQAAVSVSSNQQGNDESAAGVADGTADAREWAAGVVQDAWIRLTWDHPATIAEVELYDRRSMLENIPQGTLILEDGSTIPVPALPPDGSPWIVRFAPNTVQWLMFRINSAKGNSAGLAEIMVYGTTSH
jgi:hypothetical protein